MEKKKEIQATLVMEKFRKRITIPEIKAIISEKIELTDGIVFIAQFDFNSGNEKQGCEYRLAKIKLLDEKAQEFLAKGGG